MAPSDKTDVPVDDEWDEVSVGIGTEWDFDKRGVLIGYYMGPKEIPLPPKSVEKTGNTVATVHEFATKDEGEAVFLWDSYQLALAMTEPGMGDLVRIEFMGREAFTGDDGPRQVKRYKVSMKKK